jgi:hypothetical protein
MEIYTIEAIFKSIKEGGLIQEAIKCADKEWDQIISEEKWNEDLSNFIIFNIQHEYNIDKELSKEIMFYTGIFKIGIKFEYTDDEKILLRNILKTLDGTFSEIDGDVRRFKEEYGYRFNDLK